MNSILIWIVAIVGALALVISLIMDFVLSSKQKHDDDKKTLLAAGIMTSIGALAVILLMIFALAGSKPSKAGLAKMALELGAA